MGKMSRGKNEYVTPELINKSTRQILEIGKIDTSSTHIHDRLNIPGLVQER